MTSSLPVPPLSERRHSSRGPVGALLLTALSAAVLLVVPGALGAQENPETQLTRTGPDPVLLLPSQGLVLPAPALDPTGATLRLPPAPSRKVEGVRADRFEVGPAAEGEQERNQEQEQEMEPMDPANEVLYALGWLAATVVFTLFWID